MCHDDDDAIIDRQLPQPFYHSLLSFSIKRKTERERDTDIITNHSFTISNHRPTDLQSSTFSGFPHTQPMVASSSSSNIWRWLLMQLYIPSFSSVSRNLSLKSSQKPLALEFIFSWRFGIPNHSVLSHFEGQRRAREKILQSLWMNTHCSPL